MKNRKPRSLRIIYALAAVLMLTAVVNAFAAANVVPESGAGDGTGTVSGYTISNVTYALLTSNPAKISSLSLDVAATGGGGAATSVRITVNNGTTWITCSGPTGSTWSCAFGSGAEPLVSSVSALQVVAAQ